MEIQNGSSNKVERRFDKSTMIWVALGVIIIAIAAVNLWSVFDTEPEALTETVAVSVPDFSLTNQQGKPLGSSDMAGKNLGGGFYFHQLPNDLSSYDTGDDTPAIRICRGSSLFCLVLCRSGTRYTESPLALRSRLTAQMIDVGIFSRGTKRRYTS